MLIGIGASIYSGHRYDAAISSDNLAARFDAALGITSSGGFASAWADQSGNGRNLLQATGANQPIHLPFAGTKYGWLPGVVDNYFSTNDSVANSITGDISLVTDAALDEYIGTGVISDTIAKDTTGATELCYLLRVNPDGTLLLYWTENGTTLKFAQSTAALSSYVTAGQRCMFGVFLDVDNGASGRTIKFFYSLNSGSSWTQLGTSVVQAGVTSVFNGVSALSIGRSAYGGTRTAGKIYRALGYAGDAFSGSAPTPAFDFDPSRWTAGPTFTAATGETYTINSTGSKPAQIVDRPSLLFDGAAHYMQSVFTLAQPATVYLVAKQISWTFGGAMLDGANLVQLLIQQNTATPKIAAYAGGGFTADNSDLAIGARGVVSTVFNGASSSQQVNNGTATTGDTGVGTAGGVTLGARSSGANPANVQAYEMLIYNVAHDAATRSNIIRALMSKHGVA